MCVLNKNRNVETDEHNIRQKRTHSLFTSIINFITADSLGDYSNADAMFSCQPQLEVRGGWSQNSRFNIFFHSNHPTPTPSSFVSEDIFHLFASG